MNAQIQSQIQATPSFADPASSGSMLVTLSGALVLVLMLILAIAWLVRRSGWVSPLTKGKNILTVRHSQSLGQRERVVVVEVDDRWLLLGVTPGTITFLTEMDKKAGSTEEATRPSAGCFQQALMKAMGKKQRNEP